MNPRDIILTIALSAAAAGGSLTALTAGDDGATAIPAPVLAAGPRVDSYADVVDRVTPTVVTIHSAQSVRVQPQGPFGRQRRLPGAQPRERRAEGLGSGVIVSADGYVLTNHHVIAGADEITVELRDRRTFPATVVGSDPPSDLAVLRIDGRNLAALPLGNSDEVRVGDVVLAVGNPLGIGQTVTMGIISAKGRSTGPGDGSYEDFLQTDAPINRGNSGGPLVNLRGEVVGINSQILSPTGGNIGVAFAIPANMAKHVMRSIVADGRVHRGMIGVTVQDITAQHARTLNLPSIAGALVNTVQSRGAAADAGVRPGDVITAINGATVSDSNALRNLVAQTQPGSSARISIVRDGRERVLTATVDELPRQQAARE